MIVLGFNGGYKHAEDDDTFFAYSHDAAAALMKDGAVVSAVEEERLNRIKHSNCFPSRAIEYCLRHSAVELGGLDAIVFVSSPQLLAMYAQLNALENPALPVPTDATGYIGGLLENEFSVDVRSKLRFCDHHDAHVWSAFAFSRFEEALVLSIDGEGDGRAGAICIGGRTGISKIRDYEISQSLGYLYTSVIRILGFGCFDEYKAMGLAPYGDPSVCRAVFQQGYELLPEGDYRLVPVQEWLRLFERAGILELARRKRQPFSTVHMNVAASLQETLERIVVHILRHYKRETGIRHLCLAGGVAHNCTLNGKILRSGLFDGMFVQPAAHDAGGCLGAACWALSEEAPRTAIKPLRHVYLGPELGDDESVRRCLDRWSDFLCIEERRDFVSETARRIARGDVIAWVQGRSEFGPRALGNRSILADPRPRANRDLINDLVKRREHFRPFAPAVVEERASEFFEIPACEADLSFMTYVIPVREQQRSHLGAVTHVDGTARVQTVSRETNLLFWKLLTECEKTTGLPVILNTSLNNNAEPIVDSVEDSVVCFLTTGINALVVERYIVTKRRSVVDSAAFSDLVPRVPGIRRLVKYKKANEPRYAIESTKASTYDRVSIEISSMMYELLCRCDERSNINELLASAGLDLEVRNSLLREFFDLWSSRMVNLTPAR